MGFFLLFIVSFSTIQIRAEVVWSENFDTGTSEELSLFAWTRGEDGLFHTNESEKPIINVDNALEMPNNRNFR